MFTLPSTINGIVIPSTVNETINGTKVTRHATRDELAPIVYMVKRLFSQFGGYTVTRQYGGWVDSVTGQTIEERSLFVWSYSLADNEQIDSIVSMASMITVTLGQNSTLAVLNGVPTLI